MRGGNGGLRERGRRSWQKIEEVPKVRHKTVSIHSLKVFYREAGDPMNPKVILLGGFPASSHFAVEDSLQTIASNIQRFYREHDVSPDAKQDLLRIFRDWKKEPPSGQDGRT